MSRPTLVILVDAFRHDYLETREAPFLARLAERLPSARMRPILGYSDSIRATIFTGRYPDEHGYWMEYCFRPGAGSYAPVDRLGALDRLPSDFVRRGLKFVLSNTVVRRAARRRGYAHLSIRNIPFRALGSFDWTLRTSMTATGALGAPTLFDELTDAGVPWAYLDSSKSRRGSLLRQIDALPQETSFVFVYLHHIDMASHLVGLDSPLFDRTVRRTDALVADVVERVERRLGEPQLVVFSDHGMSTVKRSFNLQDLVLHPRFPDGFCFALDATMVRLWYLDDDPRLRDELRTTLLDRMPSGRFLEEDELADLHLRFDDRLYGDEIFLLPPGDALYPNFHSLVPPKAMHAYHPDDPEQQGIFIAPPGSVLGETVELVDVWAAARSAAGLDGSRLEVTR